MRSLRVLLLFLIVGNFVVGQTKTQIEKDQQEIEDAKKKADAEVLKGKEQGREYTEEIKVYEILVDYKSKNGIRLPKNIKPGDFYQIYVSNINRNRYGITINAKDSVYKVEPLALPTFSSISLDALASLTSGFNTSKDVSALISSADSFNISGFNQQSFILKNNLDNQFNNYVSQEFDQDVVNKIKGIIQTSRDYLKLNEELLNKEVNKINDIFFEVRKARLEYLASENIAVFTDQKEVDESKTESTDKNKVIDYMRDIEKIKELSETHIVQIEQNFQKYKKALETDAIKTYLALPVNIVSKDKTAQVTKAYNELIKQHKTLKKQLATDKVFPLLESILFMNKPNFFKSFPIQFDGDFTTVTVTKTPRDSTSSLDAETISFKFPLNEDKQYWSVGTSFYRSGLKNDRFSTLASQTMVGDTIYNVFNEGRSNGEAGISVNLRAGWQFTDYLGVHLSVGPGVSIEQDVRPRLLGGFGLSVGKKHKLVIDFGGILGYVERRSSLIDVATDYAILPETITITELKSSHYFSVGYTFNL